MKSIIISIKLALVILTIFGLLSCQKFLEIPPPTTQAQTSVVFSNDQSALSALAGLYSQLGQTSLSLLNGGVTVYAGLSAGELYNTSPDGNWDPFATNSLTPENAVLSSRFWQHAYRTIYGANSILEGLRSSSVTDSLKRQVRGEVLTVRALYYFYLVNLFGDVPLITGTDYRFNSNLSRTAVPAIYSAITADLLEAKSLLPTTYPSTARGRINKWAVTALLARVYLYAMNWSAAEQQSTEVINSPLYNLVPLAGVFGSNSNETIWQLIRDNNNTAEAATFVPASSSVKPTLALSTHALNAFPAGDGRKGTWLGKATVSGTDYFYPAKYKARTSTPITEYQVVFRLVEQYLIRAEARARQNNATGAAADLNAVRLRAGLPVTTETSPLGLLAAIEKERQCELFAEWGHRWLDLKRNGKIDAVLSIEKPGAWQSTDALYPIPFYELQTNPQLIQNPGY